jgi:hypothetical protein
MCDSAIDETDLRDIAYSPAVWWGVQREIAKGNEARSPWPPSKALRRWLAILAPTAVAAAIVISMFLVLPGPPTDQPLLADATLNDPVLAPIAENKFQETTPFPEVETRPSRQMTSSTNRTRRPIIRPHAERRIKPAVDASKPAEIKTEFIALNYAASPTSGQVVRVKVPRSMMVTLGLVARVERPTNLIDAEVVVGDDGLTRAIRFIR